MNGWQRLFTLLAALTVVPTAAVLYADRPDSSETFWAGECAGSKYYSQADANVALAKMEVFAKDAPWKRDAHLPQTATDEELAEIIRAVEACKSDLESIASGQELTRSVARWNTRAKAAAVFVSALLLGLYAVGWGLGWVWRGFFPKKPGPFIDGPR
jgi:hypothetical protein